MRNRLSAVAVGAVVALVALAAHLTLASGSHHPRLSASEPLAFCASGDCGPRAATFRWSSLPFAGTTGYYVFLNGTQVADVASSPYTYTGMDCGTTFTLGVEAHNGSGGHSSLYTSDYTTPACGTFPLQVSTNGRYLENSSGSPWLLVGDSPQSGIGDLSEANMTTYLADREAHGFNAVWEWLPCDGYGSFCNADATTYDGIAPFTGTLSACGTTKPNCYDVTTENPTYWARVAREVQQAKADGIAMFLNPMETGGCTAGQLYTALTNNGDGTVSTTDNDYKFGQWLGTWATTNGLNNIVWMAGNDFNCWSITADNNNTLSMMNGIHNTDPAALQTLEGAIPSPVLSSYRSSVGPNGDPNGFGSNIGIDGVYSYEPAYNGMSTDYASQAVPEILIESNYEGEQDGGVDGCVAIRNCRVQEWWTVTSGGAGNMYGCFCTTHLSNANYPNGMDTPGVTQLGYVTSLLHSIAWQNLVPDSNGTGHLVTSGGGTCGTGSVTTADCTTATKTADGTVAVIYMSDPSALGTITVDLSKMKAGGTTTAKWYDPTAGTYSTIGSFADTGTHSFTPASNNSAGDKDWVLLLQAA